MLPQAGGLLAAPSGAESRGRGTRAQALGEGPHPVPRLRDTPLPVAAATEGTGVREGSLTPIRRGYILSPVG